jgi:hypothetical protein
MRPALIDSTTAADPNELLSNSLDDIPLGSPVADAAWLWCQLSRDVVRLFSSTIVPG